MASDLYTMAMGLGTGQVSLGAFQQQFALTQLQNSLNSAVQTAQEVKYRAAQQGLNQAQATHAYWTQAVNAVVQHNKTIEATRQIQDYQNQMYERNKFNLSVGLQELKNAVSYNAEVISNLTKQKQAETKTQSVARGVQVESGSTQDILNQIGVQGSKDQMNQFKQDRTKVKQAIENLTALNISNNMNNWQIETQIDFSNRVLSNNIFSPDAPKATYSYTFTSGL
jgi:hypothetical protein